MRRVLASASEEGVCQRVRGRCLPAHSRFTERIQDVQSMLDRYLAPSGDRRHASYEARPPTPLRDLSRSAVEKFGC